MSDTETKVHVITRGKSHAEQLADKCVHFNGVMNDRCRAGVAYVDVRADSPEPIRYRHANGIASSPETVYTMRSSLPCHVSSNLCGATCDKQQLPTPEEVAAKVGAHQRDIEGLFTARAAIVKRIAANGKSDGVMDCPVCGKLLSLHYSQASSNGHIHARCESAGCVAWME